MAVLKDGQQPTDTKIKSQISNYKYENGLIYWLGSNYVRIYVPDHDALRKEIIKHFHDLLHFGSDKALNSCARFASWPRMYSEICQFVDSCADCQANKTPHLLPAGEFQPHEVPQNCWHTISADFVTEFPTWTSAYDTVLIIVEKLSKQAIFVPCHKDITAPKVAQLFQDHLFSKHGVPIQIISDRDPRFISHYWGCLTELLNVLCSRSTADHPQTDGQSENLIRTLSNMLRSSI